MWWLDDIFHEIGTVIPWLGFWFLTSMFLGYILQGYFREEWFRLVVLAVGGTTSVLAIFLFIEELELEFVLQLFIFFFMWGVNIGFEHRFISPKNLFSLNFWFPEKFIHSVFSRRY